MRESKAAPQEETPELLTVKEACKYIRMGKTTLNECIKRGFITAIKPPIGKALIRKSDLDSWLNTYEIPASKTPPWNRKEAAM